MKKYSNNKVLFYSLLKSIYKKLFNYKWRMRSLSLGKMNPDKTFYVIRRRDSKAGLMSNMLVFLGHIYYANKMNYIPVIDMKNYKNVYLNDDEVTKINSWLYYFEQPRKFDLDDTNESKKVVLSSGELVSPRPDTDIKFFTDSETIKLWRRIYSENIKLNQQTKAYIDIKYLELLGNEKKVLGVLCRGTDYTALKPYLHPIQPKPEEVIEKSRILMEQFGCNKIFLATEDESIFKMFSSEFGDSLVTVDSERYIYSDNEKRLLSEYSSNSNKSAYQKGLDYLTSLVILSKCNYFIGGITSGSLVSLYMSDQYEYTYFWDLGKYGLNQ